MSERYINNLVGGFSICFSEYLTGHPIYLCSAFYECTLFLVTFLRFYVLKLSFKHV